MVKSVWELTLGWAWMRVGVGMKIWNFNQKCRWRFFKGRGFILEQLERGGYSQGGALPGWCIARVPGWWGNGKQSYRGIITLQSVKCVLVYEVIAWIHRVHIKGFNHHWNLNRFGQYAHNLQDGFNTSYMKSGYAIIPTGCSPESINDQYVLPVYCKYQS